MGVDRRRLLVYNIEDVCVRSPALSPRRCMTHGIQIGGTRIGRVVMVRYPRKFSTILRRLSVIPCLKIHGISAPIWGQRFFRAWTETQGCSCVESVTLHKIPISGIPARHGTVRVILAPVFTLPTGSQGICHIRENRKE